MRIGLGLLISCVSILWVLTEGELARRNGMLTAYQMTHKYPEYSQGLPFIWHFGMWGDMFIITPVVGVIVAMYGKQWSVVQMFLMFGVGLTLSCVMHRMYVMTPFPDSLAWKSGVSPAGWMHIFYMGIAFAIIGLFYFYTTTLSPTFVVIVSVMLAVHVAIGNHIVLGYINEYSHFAWCPEFLRKPDPWITIGATCFILAGLTWRVSDLHSAGIVLLICAAFPFAYFGLTGLARVPH